MGNLGKVIACFKELGIKPKVDNFESKLVMQKVVYLLDAMGVKTGFSFSLYVRGTYSPDLTAALYDHKKEVEARETDEKLSSNELDRVHRLNDVMNGDFKSSVVEIAATYAYLAYHLNMEPDKARIRLKEMKSFYSEADFAIGINRAKELFFHPTEEDLQKLKQEMSGWDKASDEDGKKWA